MKKIFAFVILSLLFAFNMQAQDRFQVLDFGTIAEAVTETQTLSLKGWSKIDSITVLAIGTGEADVDSIDIYGAYQDATEGVWQDLTIIATGTVTLNLAAGIEDVEQIFSSNATQLTGAALRGYNALVVKLQPTDGCDATDPNNFKVGFQIHGTWGGN
jgi:hypothetical protein